MNALIATGIIAILLLVLAVVIGVIGFHLVLLGAVIAKFRQPQ